MLIKQSNNNDNDNDVMERCNFRFLIHISNIWINIINHGKPAGQSCVAKTLTLEIM